MLFSCSSPKQIPATSPTTESSKKQVEKQSDNSASRNQNNCAGDINNSGWEAFGDFCFTNSTEFDLVVLVHYHYTTFGSSSKDLKLIIKPKETKCVYSAVVENQFKYPNTFKVFKKDSYINEDEFYWWRSDSKNTSEYDAGTFQTVKCKSTTYTIK